MSSSSDVESLEFHKVIKEMKKDIYKGSNSDINKSKKDVLNVFMGDKNNKNFFNFLVDIKANYQRLENEKEQLFEKEKINYFKLIESNMNNKTSIDLVTAHCVAGHLRTKRRLRIRHLPTRTEEVNEQEADA